MWDLREAHPLTKTQPTPPTSRAPHTASVKSLPETSSAGPLGTPHNEHCFCGPVGFRTTYVDFQIKIGGRNCATRISPKTNTAVWHGKDPAIKRLRFVASVFAR